MNIPLYYHHLNNNLDHVFNGRRITEVPLEGFLLERGGRAFVGTLEKYDKRIEDLDFVGITEMFTESIFLMIKKFGWPPVEFGFDNRGNYRRSRFNDAFIERFRKRHVEDYRVYDWGVKELKKRMHEYPGTIQEELEQFKSEYMRSA